MADNNRPTSPGTIKGLAATTVAPASQAPLSATRNSGMLGSNTVTRCPGRIPNAVKRVAAAWARLHKFEYVQLSPRCQQATRSGDSSAARFNRHHAARAGYPRWVGTFAG